MNQITRLTVLGLYTIAMDIVAQGNPDHKYFILLFGVYAFEYLNVLMNNNNVAV